MHINEIVLNTNIFPNLKIKRFVKNYFNTSWSKILITFEVIFEELMPKLKYLRIVDARVVNGKDFFLEHFN